MYSTFGNTSLMLVAFFTLSCAQSREPEPSCDSGNVDWRLVEACYQGDLSAVQHLLASGHNPNSRWGHRAIDYFRGLPEPIGVNSWTPLHAAAGQCNSEIVDLLLRSGADTALEDGYGGTPLYIALKQNNGTCRALPVVSSLIRNGAKINFHVQSYFDEVGGKTPLHLAVSSNCYELVKLLVDHGASAAAEDNEGKSPSDFAANSKVDVRIRKLLR